jgi:hypothetical protein
LKIPATLQPLIDATQRAPSTLLQQLKVGQTLSAKVLDQMQPGLVRLQLASTILLARSRVALEPGTRLSLEVTKPFPLPELKILRPLSRREISQAVVRSALPKQLAPAEVRSGLDRGQFGRAEKTDAVVRQFAAIQRGAGVHIEQLTPGQVKRAVTASGLHHEARLVSPRPTTAQPATPTVDAKLQLLQLLGELRGLLSDASQPRQAPERPLDSNATNPRTPAGGDSLILRLLRLVEGSLSRIQLQQAASLPQDDPQRQAWQLDLPIHLNDEVQDAMLRIEREGSSEADPDQATWAVNLTFAFDTIGSLQCRIALAGERLSSTFWCEQAETQRKIEQRLPQLRAAFEAQGFEVVHLAGIVGQPDEPLIAVPMPDSLLDERA